MSVFKKNKTYLEHKINFLSERSPFPPSFLLRENKEFNFKDDSIPIRVEFSKSSLLFIYYCLYNKIDFDFFSRILTLTIRRYRDEAYSITDISNRIISIKIYDDQSKYLSKKSKTYELINSCFFELSLLKNLSFELDSGYNRIRTPRIRKNVLEDELEVPNLNYNEESVKKYLVGQNNIHPVLSYLSFYQVLEVYFIKASNDELISLVKRKTSNPRFKSRYDEEILSIIEEIKKFESVNNEKKQLKIVLLNYVDRKKLVEFIKEYEENLKDKKPFTNKYEIFGEQVKLDVKTDENLIDTLVTRIYTIRCALVHSKEGHLNKAKYIPSKKNEKILEIEIPLMKFLAEEVIINSAI